MIENLISNLGDEQLLKKVISVTPNGVTFFLEDTDIAYSIEIHCLVSSKNFNVMQFIRVDEICLFKRHPFLPLFKKNKKWVQTDKQYFHEMYFNIENGNSILGESFIRLCKLTPDIINNYFEKLDIEQTINKMRILAGNKI